MQVFTGGHISTLSESKCECSSRLIQAIYQEGYSRQRSRRADSRGADDPERQSQPERRCVIAAGASIGILQWRGMTAAAAKPGRGRRYNRLRYIPREAGIRNISAAAGANEIPPIRRRWLVGRGQRELFLGAGPAPRWEKEEGKLRSSRGPHDRKAG
jgi:hypothetical protein